MSIVPAFAGRRNQSSDAYDPFREYNHFANNTPPRYSSHHHNSVSSSFSTEWRDTPEAHVLKADLPGFRKEDVKVYVAEDGKMLKITGEQIIEAEEKHDHNGYYQVQRRSKSQFTNQFALPHNARADQLRSKMDKGVLTITIPKRDVNGHHKHVRFIDVK